MIKSQFKVTVPLSVLILFITALGALAFGRYIIPFSRVIHILTGVLTGAPVDWTAIEETVVMRVRLPRILLSAAVGAGLSVSGTAMQAMFSNPLVSGHILGVSYGAGFGAALGILISGNIFIIQGLAVLMGITAMGLTLYISRSKEGTAVYMLVLSGVIVGAVFQALISLIKYVADPEEKLPTIVFWLMGSLAGTGKQDLIVGLPLILFSILILYMIRWQLNVLSLNEEEALSMGINLKLLRFLVILSTTIISAVSVSLCGIIGFVGLVIPHLTRMITGPEHRHLIPASIFIGATYLIIIDTLSRSITSAEIPLSILTAVIGAPFFAYLLRRTGGKWSA